METCKPQNFILLRTKHHTIHQTYICCYSKSIETTRHTNGVLCFHLHHPTTLVFINTILQSFTQNNTCSEQCSHYNIGPYNGRLLPIHSQSRLIWPSHNKSNADQYWSINDRQTNHQRGMRSIVTRDWRAASRANGACHREKVWADSQCGHVYTAQTKLINNNTTSTLEAVKLISVHMCNVLILVYTCTHNAKPSAPVFSYHHCVFLFLRLFCCCQWQQQQ